MQIKVYFVDGVTPKQVNALSRPLAPTTRISEYQFVSKADALKNAQEQSRADREPLLEPAAGLLRGHAGGGRVAEGDLRRYAQAEVRRRREVKDGQQFSKRILSVARVIELVFLIAVLVLLGPRDC